MSYIHLTEEARKVNNGLKEIVEFCICNSVDADIVKEMSAEDFMMMQKFLKLADDCMTYMEKQAEVMDQMNEKLDRLLSK